MTLVLAVRKKHTMISYILCKHPEAFRFSRQHGVLTVMDNITNLVCKSNYPHG